MPFIQPCTSKLLHFQKTFYFPLLFFAFSHLYSDSSLFFVEKAITREEKLWGLMSRHHLPENQGMLFHYSQPTVPRFWSFNCHLNVSIAFMDEHYRIQEIKSLYAFPEKMDPKRQVNSAHDLALYTSRDPIVIFFRKNGISPSQPITYALEMNLSWFKKNGVRVGDVLCLDPTSQQAFFKSK